MYVTAPNECIALDAGTGRLIWQFKRPRTTGITAGSANRGVGVAGDRVFFETDNAHILALNRFTGDVLWETVLEDWKKNYAASSAPLPAGNLVISGVTGGEHGANGFVAAHDQETGKEVWRFWTVPKSGEPGSETWQGKDIEHGGAPTWFTGSYDPELDIVYWPTGNPTKEYNGDHRKGDNLYSDSILALDRKTGKLKWHYQFTPHDLWDWDATETSVLVDADWQGQPRKLMLHANRNGFFYVFDRQNGKLLLAKQFIKTLTWASGIGTDGRPIKIAGQDPSPEGTKVCPSQDGATNWYSPSFSPVTRLYYIQTFEKCSVYTKRDQGDWESGEDVSRRHAANGDRSETGAYSARHRYPHRRNRVGTAAAWPGVLVGRHAGDLHRPGDLRRGRWRLDGRRRGDRQAAVDVPDEPDLESLAYDLHVRRQAVHRGRGGREHHRLRSGVSSFREFREITEGTEKIHNEGTKLTGTNEEKMLPVIRSLGRTRTDDRGHLSFVRLRLLRFFVVNLLRSLRNLPPHPISPPPPRLDDQREHPIQFSLQPGDAPAQRLERFVEPVVSALGARALVGELFADRAKAVNHPVLDLSESLVHSVSQGFLGHDLSRLTSPGLRVSCQLTSGAKRTRFRRRLDEVLENPLRASFDLHYRFCHL